MTGRDLAALAVGALVWLVLAWSVVHALTA